MDYYYHEFSKLQEEFLKIIHDYPLFSEIIDDIEKKDISEINELLEKNDEFYLKKAIDKLKDLIKYVKETSDNIKKQYDTFDKYAGIWDKIELGKTNEKELNEINDMVHKANQLIQSHDINKLIEANKIMENLIKAVK